MERFTTRVELHHTLSGEYQILHEEMELRGFIRTIIIGKVKYHLPHAEYNYEKKKEITTTKVRSIAIEACREAVKRIYKKKGKSVSPEQIDKLFSILVTKAGDDRRIHNLIPVKD